VDRAAGLPEVVGCSIAIRQLEQNIARSFFVISLGYGTM